MISVDRLRVLLDERGCDDEPAYILERSIDGRQALPEFEAFLTRGTKIRWELPARTSDAVIPDALLPRIHEAVKSRISKKRAPEAPENRPEFHTMLKNVSISGRLGRISWSSFVTKALSLDDASSIPCEPLSHLYLPFILTRPIQTDPWSLHLSADTAFNYQPHPYLPNSHTPLWQMPALAWQINSRVRSFTDGSRYSSCSIVISGCPGDFLRLGHRSFDDFSCFRVGSDNPHHPLRLLSNLNCYVGFLRANDKLRGRFLLYRDPTTRAWLLTNAYAPESIDERSLLVLAAMTLSSHNPTLNFICTPFEDLLFNRFRGCDDEPAYINQDPLCVSPFPEGTMDLLPGRARTFSVHIPDPNDSSYDAYCCDCDCGLYDDDLYEFPGREGDFYCKDCHDRRGVNCNCTDEFIHEADAILLYNDDYAPRWDHPVPLSGDNDGCFAHPDDPDLIEHDGEYYIDGDSVLAELQETADAD